MKLRLGKSLPDQESCIPAASAIADDPRPRLGMASPFLYTFSNRLLEGILSILKRKRMPADLDVSFNVHCVA